MSTANGSAALLVVVGCLAGCGGSGTCVELDEEAILTALVTDNGERSRVEVEVRRGNLESSAIPVKLCAKNQLYVDDIEMTEVKRLNGAVFYEATLPSQPPESTATTTHRFRCAAGGDITEFTAAIAAPAFEILSPAADSETSRTEPLEFAWEPARTGDETIVLRFADKIDGLACLGEPFELELPDIGTAEVSAYQVQLTSEGAPNNGNCEALVTLARRHTTAFERVSGDNDLHPESEIRATTSRTVQFVSVP